MGGKWEDVFVCVCVCVCTHRERERPSDEETYRRGSETAAVATVLADMSQSIVSSCVPGGSRPMRQGVGKREGERERGSEGAREREGFWARAYVLACARSILCVQTHTHTNRKHQNSVLPRSEKHMHRILGCTPSYLFIFLTGIIRKAGVTKVRNPHTQLAICALLQPRVW